MKSFRTVASTTRAAAAAVAAAWSTHQSRKAARAAPQTAVATTPSRRKGNSNERLAMWQSQHRRGGRKGTAVRRFLPSLCRRLGLYVPAGARRNCGDYGISPKSAGKPAHVYTPVVRRKRRAT